MDDERPDEALMLAFRRGDARAFEALVRRHRRSVFNFILRFTGDASRSEDLLQETWLKVVRSAGEYEPKARFTTWLYTIARNLCTDLARRERLRETDSLDAPVEGHAGGEGLPLGERLIADDPLPDRAAHAHRLQAVLMLALASLPAEQREVFCLREFAGVPFRGIAAITHTPENTVKSRMRYALEALRMFLERKGVEGEWDSERSVAS
ncbi:MAG: RNA polymerase sigma factor [Myxococcaceae bacterium]